MAGSAMQPNKLHVHISSLSKEFRISPTREAMLYQNSRDTSVASASKGDQTGSQEPRKAWEKYSLRLIAVVGTVATGWAELGVIPQPICNKAHGSVGCHLFMEDIKTVVK